MGVQTPFTRIALMVGIVSQSLPANPSIDAHLFDSPPEIA